MQKLYIQTSLKGLSQTRLSIDARLESVRLFERGGREKAEKCRVFIRNEGILEIYLHRGILQGLEVIISMLSFRE